MASKAGIRKEDLQEGFRPEVSSFIESTCVASKKDPPPILFRPKPYALSFSCALSLIRAHSLFFQDFLFLDIRKREIWICIILTTLMNLKNMHACKGPGCFYMTRKFQVSPRARQAYYTFLSSDQVIVGKRLPRLCLRHVCLISYFTLLLRRCNRLRWCVVA